MDIRIRQPFWLSLCLLAALFFDGTAIVCSCLLAGILHETGHTLLYTLLLHRRPQLQIGLGGIALCWNSAGISVRNQTTILFAGPAVNFLFGILAAEICSRNFQLSWFVFGGVNVLLGSFNLLPLGFLDGGRLLELLLSVFFPTATVWKILCGCEAVCLLLLLAFLVFFSTDWTVRIALLFFLGYYCSKSFCAKN
jgi:stage IV sporulation protein FB